MCMKFETNQSWKVSLKWMHYFKGECEWRVGSKYCIVIGDKSIIQVCKI